MPCVIYGKLKINEVSGGVVNFGDALYIAPENVEKAISGSGGGGVGDNQFIANGTSITNGIDPDVIDQTV